MRRLVRVALGLLVTGLAYQTGVLAQYTAPNGSMLSPHMDATVHPAPSFSPAPRSFAPPLEPLFPNSPGTVSRPRPWPYGGGEHRNDVGDGDGRWRMAYPGPSPYNYGNYPGLLSYGYGLPLADGMPYGAPSGDGQNGGGGQAPPQQQAADPNPPRDDYRGPAAEPQVAANGPPLYRPAYQEPVEAEPVHPQPATTLIFKDGRPPVVVYNYALTASTLYALDGETRHEIPLSLLNLPATTEANRKAGVDFALPGGR